MDWKKELKDFCDKQSPEICLQECHRECDEKLLQDFIAHVIKQQNRIVKDNILNWILENHEHHIVGERVTFSLDLGKGTMKKEEQVKTGDLCNDVDYPYVNSIELVNFIKKL